MRKILIFYGWEIIKVQDDCEIMRPVCLSGLCACQACVPVRPVWLSGLCAYGSCWLTDVSFMSGLNCCDVAVSSAQFDFHCFCSFDSYAKPSLRMVATCLQVLGFYSLPRHLNPKYLCSFSFAEHFLSEPFFCFFFDFLLFVFISVPEHICDEMQFMQILCKFMHHMRS